ncbi:TPA: TrbC/VirB2 family protein [Campylobacter fetus subsp. venerealis]|uniref:TrbC/VirB2 family protein n=1 Tax=Campylobacter fetus TaxID=196 RepID=UPI00190C4D8D|nr:TrbC/VirB2 family protein [Campylobacter fetus]MBK3487521.1 TrbC/VirB2 family protein [Campylobacter fetus subsp. venerealis]HDX6317508.1 TrbC/VirB2 family protein [Campylobacter fetus subsp. venerealis]
MKRYLMLFFIFGAVFAFASTTGGGLPWESPLQTIKASITGPVAFTLSILAIVACGIGLVWGGEMTTFVKTLVYIVLVIALVVGATNVMGIFQTTGALI